MNRDWNDFKTIHSNIAGARTAFEDACETLFRKIYYGKSVAQVSVNRGDEGIDIFIGELGIEPITVIQCKFFLEKFGDSQHSQITKSFDTAICSKKYELKEWILCIPRVIDIDEHSWWFQWKNKKIVEYNKPISFISIKNGNELIDLLKEENLYNQIFKIDDSVKINEIHQALIATPKKVTLTKPQIALFNNYTKKNEEYYLERKVDKDFIRLLKLNNIWVFGNSGFGKTALVNRNLSINAIDYCYCDLSPINISSSEDVLEEILCTMEDSFVVERNIDEKNKIKQITQILCKTGKQKIIIVIDELSVKDNSVLKNIANDLINLVIHFCNSSDCETMKFVISTISNPADIIENKPKASEHFQYLNCDDWSTDLNKLFDILNIALCLDLQAYKKTILDSCQNSPRILKSIFRKIFTSEVLNPSTIETSIKLTISEMVG